MVNYQIIPIEVLSTDHGYNCAYTITQGDTNAYILKITYTDITEFDGTVTLRFTFPDGTYADRENVVIDGNTITYTMDETDYSQRNVSVFVRHADSTIVHTTLKIKFSNIRALPGNRPTTEIKSYPEWAADMIDYDITVGTVETLAPGADATAFVTGDVPDKILNLGIPQGDVGPQGPQGDTGASIISANFAADDIVFTKDDSNTVVLADAAVTLKGDQGIQGETGPQGIPGEVQLSDLTATNIDYTDTNGNLGDATDVQAALDNAGAQLAEKVQNFKIKNEVVNGDFSQGTTGWIGTFGVLTVNLSVANKILSAPITNSTVLFGGIRQNTDATYNAGDKIYQKVRYRVTNDDCLTIRFSNGGTVSGGTTNIVNSSVSENVWYEQSHLHTLETGSGDLFLQILHYYVDSQTAKNKVLETDHIMGINLTQIFGVGNEPTKLEMDELMKVIPNPWWDGELTLTQKQVVTWQLNLIRKNTN